MCWREDLLQGGVYLVHPPGLTFWVPPRCSKRVADPGFEPGLPDSESGVMTTTLISKRIDWTDPLLLKQCSKIKVSIANTVKKLGNEHNYCQRYALQVLTLGSLRKRGSTRLQRLREANRVGSASLASLVGCIVSLSSYMRRCIYDPRRLGNSEKDQGLRLKARQHRAILDTKAAQDVINIYSSKC